MRSRTLAIGLVVLGVVALAVAAVLAWAVVPSLKQLPSDYNATRQYEGKLKFGVDARALQSGNLRAAVLVNTPVTATRTVKVLATSGDTAEVRDERTVSSTSGQQLGTTQATYAVNRKTLEATTSHPSDWQVVDARGLTVSWPIGAQQKQYTGWVNESRSTTPLKYVKQESRGGIDTYVYQADAGAAQIKDPQVLATLPQQLPVSTLNALTSALNLSADQAAQLAAILPRLSNPVQLAYTYQVKATYWVQPTTGLVVDSQREEIRKAGLKLPDGKVVAAVLPVADLVLNTTAKSVDDAATDARDKSDQISLWGTTIPLILLIVGVLAIIAGIVLLVLRGRRGGPAPVATGGVPAGGPAG
jgi:hypothetical protein